MWAAGVARSRRRGLRGGASPLAVALDKERVVAIALLALHVALAGLVVEGPVGWAVARRAAQVVDTHRSIQTLRVYTYFSR